MSRPPMVAVIGAKNSGKTTLTVRLTAELHRRGHRVMTIKHGTHTFNIDPATTDTYRHYHEGNAERVAMISPDKFALVAHWNEEASPEVIAERHMSDADLVVCEGFKASALPKIEIFRHAVHAAPLFDGTRAAAAAYVALVTDAPERCGSPPFPVLALADPSWLTTLASIVESRLISEGEDR